MKEILVIFAKYPEPGSVKTRLSPEIIPAQAARLHRVMTDDVISLHADDPGHDTIVFFTPEDAGEKFNSWLGRKARLVPQEGDDLGARQLNAFRSALDEGYEKVVIIGSDCPCITRADIASAFAGLDTADLVLGPSEDGGYYLIGARQAHPALFEGIEWGRPQVLEDTIKKADTAGLSIRLLDGRLDIDRYEDVKKLYALLKAEADAGWPGPVIAKATFEDLDCILGAGD
jgi:rSAM/selenodomain-associated transferase 1